MLLAVTSCITVYRQLQFLLARTDDCGINFGPKFLNILVFFHNTAD